MSSNVNRIAAVVAALCLLAGCASAPARRENIAHQIAADAASFNEAYAQAVRAIGGADWGDSLYAIVYVRTIGFVRLPTMTLAHLDQVRDGLLRLARTTSDDQIFWLQEFACITYDADSLRVAQGLWKDYAKQPQLRGPNEQLPATCRQWESTLTASS
jgi:protein involved in sex pheromone biosynthesis